VGKVSDGEIRHGGGAHFPRLSQMLQYGWICSRKMPTLLTKKGFGLGCGGPWQHRWRRLG